MEINPAWIIFGVTLAAVSLLALLTARGYGLLQIKWLNTSRLRDLKERAANSPDGNERKSLQLVIDQCESVRARWVLGEDDLSLIENTRQLVEAIARHYHPNSPQPLAEARIEKILQAFLDLKTHIVQLTRLRGIREWTRFRIRHVFWLARAWEHKTRWEKTPAVQTARRFRLGFLAKWVYTVYRSLDLVFWSIKMSVFFIYDIVFKVFLIRWNLMVGEAAIRLYGEHESGAGELPEDILNDLQELPDQPEFEESGLSDKIRELVSASRNTILFHLGSMSWKDARRQYTRLVGDIARTHHPLSDQPLYEARLYDLLIGFAGLADEIVILNTKPVINKVLKLRLSHLIKVQAAANWALENQVADLVRKYKVGTAVKYSALLYKAIKKGHPGILFKDVALTLTQEAGKRWFLVYLHDRIAAEADRVYQPGARPR